MISDFLPRTGTPLTFVAPPPGLAPLVDFDLAEVDGAVGLFTLRDTAGADVRLFLVDPAVFVPDYVPDFDAGDLAALDADSPDAVDRYVVATLQEGAPVVNLLAPILVNRVTGAAAQVILDSDDWPLRAELIAPGR